MSSKQLFGLPRYNPQYSNYRNNHNKQQYNKLYTLQYLTCIARLYNKHSSVKAVNANLRDI